ncbi:MAG TPA: crossover junction endodeoxyribonuclease RuvC [Firmicutes bacterium]|uniref:Crossover junction endodeoxyribonuclease RuvC n=1 Tax=Capillibacterium thermochitinicola TaxID=2699427 RepID=A0A8J6LM58_9FIRM|nr:crossover junction endodeoxyribonuclease RuvC [Capillibacterium thermochitinicola]MBA2133309.1 crossover junction endodeoxyribonuclease RuvC [Capillibacterium thermochitinicola]HHW12265.1 crossover junction endodeoxyribonuclease RuvC [Bacillota bacterium]
MLILGVDPGTAITGYGLVEQQGQRLTAHDYGVIRTQAGCPLSERLKQIYDRITALIQEYQPDVLVVEELFFNKNTRTALAVGQARGVILLAAAVQGLTVAEYTPLQVKMAVVGYGRAEKKQVQEMVRLLLRLKTLPKPDDAADALAIAICFAHSWCRAGLLMGGKG